MMEYLTGFLLWGLCVTTASALPDLSSPLGPVVNLGYAAYAGNATSPSGEIDSSVTFFGGIPYAQPPVGNLRFRVPMQLDETVVNSGNVAVTDARNWGAPCIQQPAVVGVGSEGILYQFSLADFFVTLNRLLEAEYLEAFKRKSRRQLTGHCVYPCTCLNISLVTEYLLEMFKGGGFYFGVCSNYLVACMRY